MHCPDWLEARILQAAAYASEPERKKAEDEATIEQTHIAILEKIERRRHEH